jgi:large subunit ribosomal protein L9
MEVVLRNDVANLGRAGEVVKVRDGYARNFLIPRGLAYQATEGNKRKLTAEAKQRAAHAAGQESAAQAVADRLAQVQLTFTMKAGEGDRLFGSVTSADLSAKLGEQGFKIDKRDIELEEPIRAIGVFQVPVRVHQSVRADVRVWVVRE